MKLEEHDFSGFPLFLANSLAWQTLEGKVFPGKQLSGEHRSGNKNAIVVLSFERTPASLVFCEEMVYSCLVSSSRC
jgi:hypothetical protein